MDVHYILLSPPNIKISASLNRIRLFKEGLNEIGQRCNIYNLSSSFLQKRLISRLGILICSIKLFLLVIKANKGDFFIFYGENPFYFMYPYIRKKGYVIVERNEFSTHLISQEQLPNRQIRSIKRFEQSLSNIDGFITCSSALSNYYTQYLSKEALLIILPLIVDVAKFAPRESVEFSNRNYIAYCGDFGNNKDGVPVLIDAYSRIHRDFPSLNLFLIGGSTREAETQLHEKVAKLGLSSKVIFIGKIPHDKMPEYLRNARLLALARPANKQAEGGIPSKVGEYLSTGVPVVLTNVGELYKFLTNGVNCYMAEPDSIDSFALKLREALVDEKSFQIAQNGFLTIKKYDKIKQARDLQSFLMRITKK